MSKKKKLGNIKIKEPDKELNVKTAFPNHPVFCLKHLQNTSFEDCNEHSLFKQFIQRLKALGSVDWNIINTTQRHGIGGCEKIDISNIYPKNNIPQFITEDVKHLLAFRYGGNNLPFLCHRNGNVLHVIYIETKHGDIYDHGSK